MNITFFTTENFRFFLFALEFIVALFATYNYKKFSKTPLKILLFLIWYTFINDLIGFTLQYAFKVSHNFVLYNFYQVIRFLCIFWLFSQYVKNIKNYKLIFGFIFLYLFSFIVNFYFENFCDSYYLNTFIIGASLITISIIIYLFEILKSDKVLFVSDSLIFWVSFAHLIYFVPNIPFYIVRKYYSDSATIPYIFMINYFLLLTFNFILISGLIWSKPETKE